MPHTVSGKHILFNFVLISIAALILFFGLTAEMNIYDEAITLVGAERISYGEQPYSDFWTLYAPGQFYLLSGVFQIFGSSILTERIVTVLTFILMAWAWLAIARRVHPGRSRFVALMVLAAWVAMIPLFGRAIPTALLFSYISCYFLFRHFESYAINHVFWSGFFLGMAAMFRHDVAGFLFGAIFQAVFFFSLSNPEAINMRFGPKILFGLKRALVTVLGLIPFLIPLLLLISNAGIEALWTDLIAVPMTVFREFRSLPFPDPIDALSSESYPIFQFWRAILFYIPAVIFITVIVGIIIRVKKKLLKLNGPRFWIEITAFNFGINLYNTAMVRSDLEHTFPAWTGAILCLLVIFDWMMNQYARGVITVLAFAFVGGYPMLQLLDHFLELRNEEKVIAADRSLFPASLNSDGAKEYLELIEAIRLNTEPGDYLYSGIKDHTDFLINDMMIYHLTETRPASFFHELHPGVTTPLLMQNRIFSDIDSTAPKLVVLGDFGRSREDNKSKNLKTSDVITPYIKSHYTKIQKFGNYTLYARNNELFDFPIP